MSGSKVKSHFITTYVKNKTNITRAPSMCDLQNAMQNLALLFLELISSVQWIS